MTASVEQIEAEALRLPAAERARLAEQLIASLDNDADVEQAWAPEVQRRLAELDASQTPLVSAEDVLSEARARLA